MREWFSRWGGQHNISNLLVKLSVFGKLCVHLVCVHLDSKRAIDASEVHAAWLLVLHTLAR